MNQDNSSSWLESTLDALDYSKEEAVQLGLKLLGILGFFLTIHAFYLGFKHEIFTSETALRNLLDSMGHLASIGFILIQILQAVIPIIPGALTIPMGAMVFGMGYGFLLSFIGIVMGSIINFALARQFGRPLVKMLVSEKQFNKYIDWMDSPRGFDKLFTFAMFFPLSPDDLLCYFAGLSNLSFKKFVFILGLSKPITLFIYAYGMKEILTFIFQFLA